MSNEKANKCGFCLKIITNQNENRTKGPRHLKYCCARCRTYQGQLNSLKRLKDRLSLENMGIVA